MTTTTSHNPDTTAHLWQRAASFAARAHQGQLRKDDATPYFAHPCRVALTVRHLFNCDDPVCLAAALLHDVIEDSTTDYDDLLQHFGKPVADCVAALSKDPRLPEPQREPAYDRQLTKADWRAKLVKLADVYDNTCDRIDRTDKPSTPKLLNRCRRALTIAASETSPNEPLQTSIAAVQQLILDVEAAKR